MELEIQKCYEQNLNCFKLQYVGQNVEKVQEFKNWYNFTNQKIAKENIRNKNEYLKRNNLSTELLLISFCPYCCSYSVCSYKKGYCIITCKNCYTNFCVGCYQNKLKYQEFSVCLKGYIKLLYLRIKYRRLEPNMGTSFFYFIQILVMLFLTPFMLGFISNMMGLTNHKKKTKLEKRINEDNINKPIVKNEIDDSHFEDNEIIKISIFLIYSFCKGLLMFPYEIVFFPFMIILLLPGIFFRKYYFTIFVIYITSVIPGAGYLDNDISE